MTQALEAGGEQQEAAVNMLHGSVRRLAFDAAGCRVVQLALQVADRRAAAELASELHGHVREAIGSPHGNYVIQKVIEVMPTALAHFVAEELRGVGATVARHRYGCRILCRLLEHSAPEPVVSALADEVLAEANELCRHSFGHHVIQSILEHGLPAQRQRIADTLRSELPRNARNRNASHVIEKALTYCSPEDRDELAGELLANPEDLASMAQNQFGSYVVRALLRLPGEGPRWAMNHLRRISGQLQATKCGQRLLADLGIGPQQPASAAPAA